MNVRISPLPGVALVIVAGAGIATTILAMVDATVTGDWLDATATAGYPAVGFLLLALAGLGVIVFLGAAAVFIALLVAGSRTAGGDAS